MTPNEIEVLIHYHVCTAKHPRADSPAVQKATKKFLEAGLIKENFDGRYQTTEGGRMLIEALCAVPFPVQRWAMP